jgi:MoxR-like ATPase
MRFSLGYPTLDEELKMLELLQRSHPIDSLEPVVTAEELTACQRAVREVYVDDKVRRYLMQIVHDTRAHDDIGLGGSPRASIASFALRSARPRGRTMSARRRQKSRRVLAPVICGPSRLRVTANADR